MGLPVRSAPWWSLEERGVEEQSAVRETQLQAPNVVSTDSLGGSVSLAKLHEASTGMVPWEAFGVLCLLALPCTPSGARKMHM